MIQCLVIFIFIPIEIKRQNIFYLDYLLGISLYSFYLETPA